MAVPPKVKVEIKGQKVFVEGPKGKLDFELPRRTSAKRDGTNLLVSRDGEDAEARALHGLSRAIVNNMVKGVSDGFCPRQKCQPGPGVFASGQLSHSRPDQGDGRGKHQGYHRGAEQTVGRPGRR